MSAKYDAASNPFPGLRPFSKEEKHLFFGREEQVLGIIQRLRLRRFVAVLGASGSGKSSLVKAGLLPELLGGAMAGKGSAWEVVVARPGADPVRELAQAMSRAGVCPIEEDELEGHLEATLRRSALGLVQAMRQSLPAAGANWLIVIDQFEELFRFHQKREEAQSFVNLLLEASRQTEWPLFIAVTMRSDFLGDCTQFPGLAETINDGQYLLPRMTRAQLRLAIEGPVRVAGGRIEAPLVQRLLNDVGDDPDQLPILQHALMRTWEAAAAADSAPVSLSLRHYEAIGTMAEALSRHADEIFGELADDRARSIASRMFKALTELGPDNRGVRRPRRLGELSAICSAGEEEIRGVVGPYQKGGRTLLMPPPGVELTSSTVIDISHESLMRVWKRLGAWVAAEAQSAAIYRRLAETAALWKKGEAGLFRDPDLSIALAWREQAEPNAAWAEAYHDGFATAIEFLEASHAGEQAEKQAREAAQRRELEQAQALAASERLRAAQQTQIARRLRVIAAMMMALVIVALVLRAQADREHQIALSREMAARAVGQLGTDPELSVLLAIESLSTRVTTQSRDVLRRALFASHVRSRYQALRGAVNLAEVPPEGRHFLTACEDGELGIWRQNQTNPVLRLSAHDGNIRSASFGADAGDVLTAGDDGAARVWRIAPGEQRFAITNEGTAVVAAFLRPLPEGFSLVSAAESGLVRVSPGPGLGGTERMMHAAAPLRGAALSPDQKELLTWGADRVIQVWNLSSDSCRLALTNSAAVLVAGWSISGASIVAGDETGAFIIWSGATGRLVSRAVAHDGPIRDIAFSPDGTRLVTVSDDHVAKVWILPNLSNMPLRGHHGAVLSARFSPDGMYVVTASADTTARLWSLRSFVCTQVFAGHAAQVNRAVFTPDGASVITASSDGTARVWQVRAGRFQAMSGPVLRAAFSDDGSVLQAMATGGTSVRCWRLPRDTAESGARGAVGEPDSHSFTNDLGWTEAALSGDGQRLALGALRDTPLDAPPILDVLIVDTRSGERVGGCVVTNGLQMTLSSDGKRLAATANGLAVFDVPTGKLRVWIPLTNHLETLRFSPDGTLLAGGGANAVSVWRVETGRLERTFACEDDVRALAFSPENRTIAAGCRSGAVYSFDLKGSLDAQLQYRGHLDSINTVVFSGNGRFLVTASSDGSARLWAADTATELALFPGESTAARAAAFAPDLRSVFVFNASGLQIRYACPELLPDEELMSLAGNRLTRRLRPAEQREFLHSGSRSSP